MKFRILLIIGLIFLIILFLFFSVRSLRSVSKDEILADQVMKRAAKKIEFENNLYLIGIGGQMLNKIQLLTLDFQGFREVQIDEARQLMVRAVETFVNEINSNQEIKPYLINYPFTEENIELGIWFYKSDHSNVGSDNVFFVFNNRGNIEYYPGRPKYDVQNPMLIEAYDGSVISITN